MNKQELNIVYYDNEIVVVCKQANLLSVPGRGPEKADCIVRRVRDRFPESIEYPAVHRLDMATSGLMVLALTKFSYRDLSIQFQERLVEKKYIALVEGIVRENSGTIELSFRLDPDNRPFQIYDPQNGKTGITKWEKINIENGNTRVAFFPVTGRTHQLRLHSAHSLGLGKPIIGDPLYGNGKQGDILKLHSAFIKFRHPVTKEDVSFTSVPGF